MRRPVRAASLVAGVALLLMAALAGFGYNFAIHGLITAGNAARTAQDIMAHQGLFGRHRLPVPGHRA